MRDRNGHEVTFIDPKTLGIGMAEGVHHVKSFNKEHSGNPVSDRIDPPVALDRASYLKPRRRGPDGTSNTND